MEIGGQNDENDIKYLSFGAEIGNSSNLIKKLNTSFAPDTFLAKAGVGKTIVNLKRKAAAFHKVSQLTLSSIFRKAG
jgi:hypothetical protein